MTPSSKSNCKGCCKHAQNLWRYLQKMCVFSKEMHSLHCLQEVLLTSSSACTGRADFQEATYYTRCCVHESCCDFRECSEQAHQGQKGQVASLSPQSPRPLMLTWEPAQVLCWSPGKWRLRTAQKAFGTQLWRVGSSARLASWAGYPAGRIGVAGGRGREDHRTGGRKEAEGRAIPPRSASC